MKTILAALIFSTALGAAAAPAAADPRWSGGYEIVRDRYDYDHPHRRYDILPERRIARLIYREGFAEIEDIRLRRGRYVATAVRPNGAVFRLAFDAYDGALLSRERIGWSRGYDRRGYDRGEPRIEFRLGL